MTCSWSHDHYQDCLDRVCDSIREGKKVELVHDIDMPTATLEWFGTHEAEKGLRSVYFIRLHAVGYNALSHGNIKLWRELTLMGHEIGLHAEPDFFRIDVREEFPAAIAEEARILSFEIGYPVRKVSAHEPARLGRLGDRDVPVGFQLYGFGSRHYEGAKYISDSGCRWPEGCMCTHIGKHERLIVLTHPIWWYKETSAENY